MHRAEAAAKPVAAARRLLSQPPISESDAADNALLLIFQNHLESPGDTSAAQAAAAWRATSERNRQEAKAVLDQTGA